MLIAQISDTHILDPSRDVESNFRVYSIRTAEGKVLTYDLVGRADASGCNAVGDAIAARVEKLL